MIALAFALPAESSDFVRLLTKPIICAREGVESIRGQIHGRSVAVFHTGVGEKSCRGHIENFLRQQQFKFLISAGFAGALDHELQIGNLLLSENFSSSELLDPRISISRTLGFSWGNWRPCRGSLIQNPSAIAGRQKVALRLSIWKRSSSRRRARLTGSRCCRCG